MKKLRYSTGLKATIAIVQQVLFVILVISILIVTALFQKNILDFGDIRNKSFSESAYFSSLFQDSTEDILNFVELRKKFETEGNYDREKQIDIRKYYASQGRAGDETAGKAQQDSRSRYYYLGDLVEWARSYTMEDYEFSYSYSIVDGLYQEQTITRNGNSIFSVEKPVESLGDMNIELQQIIVSSIRDYYNVSYHISNGKYDNTFSEEAAQSVAVTAPEEQRSKGDEQLDNIISKVVNGKLYDLNSEELCILLNDMDMAKSTCVLDYDFVNEDYLSVDGKGIWNDFIKGEYTEAQMQEAYKALEYTLQNIGKEVNTYKKCLNRYNLGKEGSNVHYWIKTGKEDKVYTNLENGEVQNFTEYGKQMGKYFFYRESDMRLETNVKNMEDTFYNRLEQMYGGKDSILFVCVNTKLPQQDSFYLAKQEYNQMYPWIYIGTVAMVVSGLGCLICFLYLSTVAGKCGEDEEPVVCWFDKIPTELIFIGASISVLVTIIMYGEVLYRFEESELAGLLIISGVIAFFSTALLMALYLSFVRRIRAGILWSGSLAHWVVQGIGSVFQLRRSATKMLVWFAIHLVGCVILFPMIMDIQPAYQSMGIIGFLCMSLIEGVLIIREGIQRNRVMEGIQKISSGDLEFKINTADLTGDNRKLAEAVNTIGEGLFHAVDDSMKNERLKADLITNVSHDIKTPLTSIINYVDLLKREDIPNERAQNYLAVLEQKSQRLKQLTEDLLEASKISSGNITLQMERINFVELVYQTGGEFNEKFEAKGLTAVTKLPGEPVVILADGRRIWRVVENLYNNVAKYAMANTRVYVDMQVKEDKVMLSIKNISQNALNIQADELTERFIRGDVSRSTEGSGLGLSIAKNLTNLMGGEFEIYLDGDLFKVTISFKREPGREKEENE